MLLKKAAYAKAPSLTQPCEVVAYTNPKFTYFCNFSRFVDCPMPLRLESIRIELKSATYNRQLCPIDLLPMTDYHDPVGSVAPGRAGLNDIRMWRPQTVIVLLQEPAEKVSFREETFHITAEYCRKMELTMHLVLDRPKVSHYWYVSRSLPNLSCCGRTTSCCAAFKHTWSNVRY
jgi:hypothetical protein